MTPKERAAEQTRRLRDAAAQQDPLARSVVDLLRYSFEDAKERLVDASGDDLLRTQGAAKQLKKLIGDLTRTPLATPQPKE